MVGLGGSKVCEIEAASPVFLILKKYPPVLFRHVYSTGRVHRVVFSYRVVFFDAIRGHKINDAMTTDLQKKCPIGAKRGVEAR